MTPTHIPPKTANIDSLHHYDGNAFILTKEQRDQVISSFIGEEKESYVVTKGNKIRRKDNDTLPCSIIKDDGNNYYALYHQQLVGRDKNYLGQGAFGKVKLAQNIQTGEWVAIKRQTLKSIEQQDVKSEEEKLKRVRELKGAAQREIDDGYKSKFYTIMKLLNGKDIWSYIINDFYHLKEQTTYTDKDTQQEILDEKPSKTLTLGHNDSEQSTDSEESIDLGTLVIKEQEEDSSQSTTENESLSKKPAFMRQPARTMTKPIKIENPEEFNIIMAANYEARLKKIRANKITQFETSRLHSLPHLAILINAVIAATEFVHHATLLHLDIKPDNIVYDPETGLAKLTDFGGSLISDKAGIDADPTRGSPMFLEPEQEAAVELPRSEKIGYHFNQQSDYYQLGQTILSLVTVALGLKSKSILSDKYVQYQLDNPQNDKLIDAWNEILNVVDRLKNTPLEPKAYHLNQASKEIEAIKKRVETLLSDQIALSQGDKGHVQSARQIFEQTTKEVKLKEKLDYDLKQGFTHAKNFFENAANENKDKNTSNPSPSRSKVDALKKIFSDKDKGGKPPPKNK